MAINNYPNWARLLGALVEIRQNGVTIRTGIVEEAMPDSSALWLAAEGVHRRTIYEAAEQYESWVEPQYLTGTASYRMTTPMLYTEPKHQEEIPRGQGNRSVPVERLCSGGPVASAGVSSAARGKQ